MSDDTHLIIPVWHSHHKWLLGFVDPERRHAEIDVDKPEHERATRHRRLRPVVGVLPQTVVAAGLAYRQSHDAVWKAWGVYLHALTDPGQAVDAFWKAWGAYERTLNAHRPAIEALHAQECGCGQAWDGEMRFP